MDEVTKRSFENGLTAVEWLAVLQAAASADPNAITNTSLISVANTLFNLLAQWPANQAIVEYMAGLLKSQLLPLHMFTSVFLRTTRSSEAIDPRSLDMVCQLIISTTQASPLDTIVSVVDPLEPIATTLLDIYNLMRRALGVPYTTIHDLQSSASNILLLALQYSRPFLPQLSSTEILQLLTLGHEISQQPNIRPELLNLLENVNQLLTSLLAVSNTLPSTHGEILAMSMPQPELAPSETSDIVSCSLLIRNLVDYRAHLYGCGNIDHTITMIMGLFRWTGSSIQSFYTEIIRASTLHFIQSFQLRIADPLGLQVWSSFIHGALPRILKRFIESSGVPNSQNTVQSAVTAAFEMLQPQLEFALPFPVPMETDDLIAIRNPSSFRTEFLNSLVSFGILDSTGAKSIQESWSEKTSPCPLLNEFSSQGQTLDELLDNFVQSSGDEQKRILELFVTDPCHQNSFIEGLITKTEELANSFDLIALSTVCETLYTHPSALDVLALHTSIPSFIKTFLRLVEKLDWSSIDDPQTSLTYFGNIILFLQSTIGRFKLNITTLEDPSEHLRADYVIPMRVLERKSDLDLEETKAYEDWYKALFDPNSDGVDDFLVRSYNPKILLKLSPVLVSEAIRACEQRSGDQKQLDSLRNGISYFQDPLLSWTLVGVVRCIALQLERKGPHAPIHADILQRVIAASTPILVKLLQRTLMRVLSNHMDDETSKFRNEITASLGNNLKSIADQPTLSNYSHKLAPAVMIRATFLAIRSNKAVTLDIPVCLELMSATEFLLRLFTEIYNTAQLGDGESAQRIVAHALSYGAQKDGAQPWLLPLFVLSCIPNVLSRMNSPDTLHIETLATIIASSFRLSLFLDKAKGVPSPEPTTVVCQQFSKILQRKDLGEGAALLRKSLRASQAFASQFPQFR
ncbi:hypothetical protein CPB86DRAFT_722998 [Serendipita vermifera]|nr:hypothetical protein CPB86DRAFT_722998 [Serendipita vermifera]